MEARRGEPVLGRMSDRLSKVALSIDETLDMDTVLQEVLNSQVEDTDTGCPPLMGLGLPF